jgi:hypothetical protein
MLKREAVALNEGRCSRALASHDEPAPYGLQHSHLAGLIDGYFAETFKPTEQLIRGYRGEFISLGDVSEVMVLGHSLGEVDAPYFREIASHIAAVDSDMLGRAAVRSWAGDAPRRCRGSHSRKRIRSPTDEAPGLRMALPRCCTVISLMPSSCAI